MRIELDQNSAGEKLGALLSKFGDIALKAGTRAMNRAVMGVRTDAVPEVRKDYNIKPTPVRKSFKIQRAGKGLPEATATASGSRIPLVKFGALPKKPGGRRRPARGASVMVKHTRKTLTGSFVARMKAGHIGLFTRSGDSRLPIEQKFGPSIPEMIGSPDVVARIQDGAEERFSKNLDHEINYALEKMGAR